ncbi:hypothetical protein L1987_65253 [Smallanthus sonchifolius]|uniref:Uncharacterized protein n=1 Tax=Smallanthus sonchifolius TaxID=185202 RepID=A0ACB9BTX7_9ASTR|nr:hypothetical protein L1987_65253 [Smallanthus sonchifolius]
MAVLWNLSVRKVVAIVVPNVEHWKFGTVIVNVAKELRKNGEPIFEIVEDHRGAIVVYESYAKRIDDLEVDGINLYIVLYSYMDTLLLLDQPDFKIYIDKSNATLQGFWNTNKGALLEILNSKGRTKAKEGVWK